MKSQQGSSLLSIAIFLALLIPIVLAVVKLYPSYWEFYQVRSIIDEVARTSPAKDPNHRIMTRLKQQFEQNTFSVLTWKDVKIQTGVGTRQLLLDYQVEEPWLGNIGLIVYFKYEANLNSG